MQRSLWHKKKTAYQHGGGSVMICSLWTCHLLLWRGKLISNLSGYTTGKSQGGLQTEAQKKLGDAA